jgi:tRNA threonylcarbamoyladenosine biosynthesis protein TsaE
MPPESAARPLNLPVARCVRCTEDPEATRALARRLAARLRPDDFLALCGELGAGKTTFVQGLAAGLGVEGRVSSPTFVLMHCHPGRLPLCHLDAYRVGCAEEFAELGVEDFAAAAVTVLEWADRLPELWPPEVLVVTLAYTDTGRRLEFEGRGPRLAALVEELCADDSGD